MDEGLQGSDMIDPLAGHSSFSLFPRTFCDLMKAADSRNSDLESVHNYLKSMALRSPNKLLEQAKITLRTNSELLNTQLPAHMASEDKVGAAAVEVNDHIQERRPALNRKRARFSLKPIVSQPSLDVNPSLNIDQLEDPEEYFLAHEKLENTKMELRKQLGDAPMGSDQYNLTETTTHRRPGLLGKRASYKHHCSSLQSEDDEIIISSQQTFEVGMSSPPKYISSAEATDQHGAPEERKIAGAEHVDSTQEEGIALKEQRVGKHLDELLSADCMDLDENGVITFLQERLQFKLVNLEKLSLPGLDSILRNDFEAPVEQLVKPRKALADIHNTSRREYSKTAEGHRQLLGVSGCPYASPLLQKSPLASLSFLRRRISHMTSPSDPFSVLDSDISPARHSFRVEGIGQQAIPPNVVTDHLDDGNCTPVEVDGKGLRSSGEVQSQLVGEEGITAANSVESGKLVIEHLASSLDTAVDENPNGHDTSMNVRSNGSEGGSEDKIEDVLQEAATSEQHELIVEGLPDGPLHCIVSQLDQLGPTTGEQHSVDEHAETRDTPLEQNDEENKLNSRAPPNMQTKPKSQACERGKRTRVSHRQSLAGAGSLWQAGVRRSNRIRIKPLDWWNGERFLYGRIHESLETVIGLKYVSPAKDGGKPKIKVKSYVSDEFKHLVEQAGLH